LTGIQPRMKAMMGLNLQKALPALTCLDFREKNVHPLHQVN
jgi:hypothetical protein